MDRIDYRLLAALHQDALQSVRSLAKAAKVSPPVAHERLRKLAERGTLLGFVPQIDPAIFGKVNLIAGFSPIHSREEARRVLEIPGVFLVAHKVDGGLTVGAWVEGEDATLERVVTLLGAEPFFQTRSAPKTVAELSPLDWKVLRACVDKPRHSTHELVALTGLSPRTAVKRRDALIASGILYIAPNTGLLGGGGEIVYTISVAGAVPRATIRRHLGDCVVIRSFEDPPLLYLIGRADDLGDALRRTKALRGEPGIMHVEITLNREVWVNVDMMRKAIDERIAFWKRAKRP
jgi:DNA-binding Lrp family transcriptional regulator